MPPSRQPRPAHQFSPLIFRQHDLHSTWTRHSRILAKVSPIISGAGYVRYLTAILNSDTLTQLVRPLQARGEHNPRHFDKYIFQLPIPLYDPGNPEHRNWPN